jgi:hypothetical protein
MEDLKAALGRVKTQYADAEGEHQKEISRLRVSQPGRGGDMGVHNTAPEVAARTCQGRGLHSACGVLVS